MFAVALLLATGSLLAALQGAPLAWPRAAAQSGCIDPSNVVKASVNWGAAQPTVCANTGETSGQVVNWGGQQAEIASINDLTPTSTPAVAFDQSVGQAAGEVGAPSAQLLGVCSSPPCPSNSSTSNQNVAVLGVCSSPPCTITPLTIPGLCSSPPCPTTTPAIPTGVCSRPPCPSPSASATVPGAQPSQVPRPKLDPKWATVEQWVSDILTAQQQVFTELGVLVPTNVVMAEMMIETQGVMPDGPNSAGAEGLLQITPYSFGASHYDFDRMNRDPAYSIYCGIYDLALRYLDSKDYNKDNPGQPLPWANVIVGFFSGHYFPNGADDGYNSDFQYQNAFIAYFNELEAAGGAWSGGGDVTRHAVIPGNWLAGVGQPIKGLDAIWTSDVANAGDIPPLTQEFGPTDFSINVHPDWYSYSLAYGFAQPGHTGLDVGIPAGTPLYSPTDGIVYCAGTDNPGFPDEEGCAAFASSAGGPTSGRMQIKLPSGDMLILGHVNQSVVAPGAHVVKGQLVAYSGGMNGDHVHVEYRVPDSSTDSGWRIIDPRLTPLNGLPIPVVPVTVTTTPKATQTVIVQPTATTEVVEAPTEAPTEAATEVPTAAPTVEVPTEAPTEPPAAPTEPPPDAPTAATGSGPPVDRVG